MYYVRMGLHGPGWLYVLGMLSRADVPLTTPRARATDLGRGLNLRMGSGRAPCVPTEPRARGETRGRERKKCRMVKKRIYIYMYTRFPFGMCV